MRERGGQRRERERSSKITITIPHGNTRESNILAEGFEFDLTHLFVFGLQLLLEVAVRRPSGIAGIVYLLLIASLRRLRQLVSLSLRIVVIRCGELFF